MDQAENQSSFKYGPLESINHTRLLVLHQGFDSDPIRCSLIQATPDWHTYEALSYEWGPLSDNALDIHVNSCNVGIRRNLHDALVHIRLEKQDRYLWVDAICIDQTNVQERDQQVQMMGRIYTTAEQVVVWLGLATKDSDIAMEFINKEHLDPRNAYMDMNSLFLNYEEKKMLLFDPSEADLKAVLELCSRSYWSRVWVTQEVHLAKKLEIHCGGQTITEEALNTIYDHSTRVWSGWVSVIGGPAFVSSDGGAREASIKSLWESIRKSTAVMAHVRKRHWLLQKQTGTKLEEWLWTVIEFDFECSEVRDFVFALLGISCDLGEGEVAVHYETEVESLFVQVMEIMVAKEPDSEPVYMLADMLVKKMGLDVNHRIVGEWVERSRAKIKQLNQQN